MNTFMDQFNECFIKRGLTLDEVSRFIKRERSKVALGKVSASDWFATLEKMADEKKRVAA